MLVPTRTLELPPHLRNTTARFEADLLDEPTAARLRALLKRLGREGLPSNTQDLKFYTTVHEHIGEAVARQGGYEEVERSAKWASIANALGMRKDQADKVKARYEDMLRYSAELDVHEDEDRFA